MMDAFGDNLGVDACMQRGWMLYERNRPAEAVEFSRRALGQDPHHPEALALLALCLVRMDGHEKDALHAAYDAVSAAPENGRMHTVLAFARMRATPQGQNAPLRQALTEIDHAISLDTDNSFAHVVRASILLRLEKWNDAERAARRALELAPDDTQAASIVSAVMMHQGRRNEQGALAEDLLARNPEDPAAHIAAGFNFLQRGEHQQANTHFLEALRLEPGNEGARLGLMESYRARSPFYRALLAFSSYIARVSNGFGQWVLLGGFVAYQTVYQSLIKTAPLAAALLMTTWLIFALWSHLARGIASFVMLTDRTVRVAMDRKETIEALATGIPCVLALLALGGWLGFGLPGDAFPALLLFLAAVVAAAAASNEHHQGKWLYLAAAVFVVPVSLLFLLMSASGTDFPALSPFVMYALRTAVIVTWLRAFGVLYR